MVFQQNEEETDTFIKDVDFDKMGGLVPVVVQDASNDQVLMQAFMNKEALKLTMTSGKMHYWSRTRNRIWMKGETSFNYSIMQNAILDCDNDSILFKVQQIGVCCHTGNSTCFHNPVLPLPIKSIDARVLERIFAVINDRVKYPNPDSYVSNLSSTGEDAILRKIGEEATELILAVKSEGLSRSTSEATDLLFHMLVLLAHQSISLNELFKELEYRHLKKTQKS